MTTRCHGLAPWQESTPLLYERLLYAKAGGQFIIKTASSPLNTCASSYQINTPSHPPRWLFYAPIHPERPQMIIFSRIYQALRRAAGPCTAYRIARALSAITPKGGV